MRLLYVSCSITSTKLNNATAAMAMRNFVCQSLFLPESISSAKIRVNIGTAIDTAAVSSPKVIVSQKAPAAPLRWCLTYFSMLVLLPPFSNFSVGENSSATPVNDLQNSSMGTSTGPMAGSLRQALPFLKPRNTTKCSKFQ